MVAKLLKLNSLLPHTCPGQGIFSSCFDSACLCVSFVVCNKKCVFFVAHVQAFMCRGICLISYQRWIMGPQRQIKLSCGSWEGGSGGSWCADK